MFVDDILSTEVPMSRDIEEAVALAAPAACLADIVGETEERSTGWIDGQGKRKLSKPGL